jgi:fructokinase
MNPELPRFLSFGEALTDLVSIGTDHWLSIPGGAPWNVARVMSTFGISSAFGGSISSDCFGDALWQASSEARLDLRFLQRNSRSPLLAVVYETQPPHYFFIGENSADLAFDSSSLPAGWESAVEWAHFGGISLMRRPLAERLVALAERLKGLGVRISYDPNYRALMDESYDETLARMVKLADLVKVSEEDLRGLFRTCDENSAFQRLRAMNPEASYFYTRGKEGAEFHTANGRWRAEPPSILVVDTVGAGDCSVAGMLSSLMLHPNLAWEQHVRTAIAAGSGACMAAGATPPQSEIVERLAADVLIEALA